MELLHALLNQIYVKDCVRDVLCSEYWRVIVWDADEGSVGEEADSI